jgi:hypothetical protein
VAVFNGEAMSVDFGVISQNFQRSPPRLEKEIVLLGLQLFWSETGVYPLGKRLQTTMEISTIFNGKIHYFYGASGASKTLPNPCPVRSLGFLCLFFW